MIVLINKSLTFKNRKIFWLTVIYAWDITPELCKKLDQSMPTRVLMVDNQHYTNIMIEYWIDCIFVIEFLVS